jgi:PAS domain S-box-containing protein
VEVEMKDERKTKAQLLNELVEMRQRLAEANRRIADLEAAETECGLAEEALEESRAEFSAMFDNAPITLVLVDQDRRVRRANRVASELSGRSTEDMIGLRDGEALRCVYSLDDPEGCGYAPFCAECALRNTVLDTIETGRGHHRVEVELPLAREDGQEEKHFLVTTTPVTISKSQLVLVSIEDITERKRAEESLRESEERYRSVVENSHAGILIVGSDYRLIYANDEFRRILGYEHEEIVGRDFLEFFDEEAKQLVADRYVRRQRGEDVPPRYESTIVRKDGEKREVELHVALIRDSVGNVQTIGQILDITERKRAEEEIAQLAKYPSENPNPVLRIARDCSILLANEASLPLLVAWGCQVGQCLSGEWSQIILDVFASRSSKEVEVEVEDRIFSLTFAPVVEADYANVYGLDITERKRVEEALAESESRLRSTLVSMDDLVFVFDRQGRFTLWYAPLTELYMPPEEFMGKKYSEVLPPSVDKLSTEAFNKNRGGETAEYEYQLEVDGEARWYSAKLSPMFLDDEFAGSVAVIRNVTGRKQAEEALRRYAAELEARNEELDAFAHTAAHDLKNPLGLVIGFADVLEMDYAVMAPEDLEKYVQAIAQNGRRMGRIVDELLLLASVRQAEVEAEPLDMGSVVRESLQRLVDMIEKYEAEIILPESWPMALGCGPWIEEVWVNYLDNAIKYGSRPPRVELGAEVLPPSIPPAEGEGKGGMVRFWVRDNGQGLTPEEQERLFRPFARLDQVRVKGHGLGLSIVRRIVEKLGGEVEVESEEGQGSVFSFTLPSVPEAE